MTGGDPLAEAAAELYSADPAEFVERRGALAARARAAGQTSAARRIAALRKPTRSAWVINRLIRSDPGAAARLAGLGDELRAAQGSLDGAAIRELSARRRKLIGELSRQAFAASGLPSPSPALRDEVTATLGAALADPGIAGQLAAGTLERACRADGFGPAGAPVLTMLPGGQRAGPSGGAPPAPARRAPARRASAGERAEAAARARADNAAREREERERRRRAALAEAEQAVAEADKAAAAAGTAELDLESTVQRLEVQLAEARQDLTSARLAARRARNRQRQARQARDRLRGADVDGPDPRT